MRLPPDRETLVEAAIETVRLRHEPLGVECQAYLHDDVVFLDDLHRDRDDPATKGRGADAVRDLCALADQEGLGMELSRMADEPGLAVYYGRFGFRDVVTEGGNPDLVTMVRPATGCRATLLAA